MRADPAAATAAIAPVAGCDGATTEPGTATQTGGAAAPKPTGDALYDEAVKECFEQANQLPAGPDRTQANQDCKEAGD